MSSPIDPTAPIPRRSEPRTTGKALGAMRRLNDRFGGFGPGQWTFDGEHIPDGPVVDALLSFGDTLNDVDRELGSGVR